MKGMRENIYEGIISDCSVNLPIQIMSLTARDSSLQGDVLGKNTASDKKDGRLMICIL